MELGFDTHRPLRPRLLYEAELDKDAGWNYAMLAKVYPGIGTWLTRLWMSERPMSGMNKAFALLAQVPVPTEVVDLAEFWLDRIQAFRYSRVSVPDDEAVREGIHNRMAYGGSARGATKTILCRMMESEQLGDSPARDSLTVEHIMPQKLTDEWKQYLGGDAEWIHGQYRHKLATLTLSGVYSELGSKSFEQKRRIMKRSAMWPLTLTLSARCTPCGGWHYEWSFQTR